MKRDSQGGMMHSYLLILAVLMSHLSWAQAKEFDHTIFDKILKTNVDQDGFIDYDSIRISKGGDLYEYIAFLEDAEIKDYTEEEKTAFWINAHNAHIIRMILARPSLNKVSEDFDLFDQKFKVARIKVSLNDIAHRILRSDAEKGGPVPNFSVKDMDPRIHFALTNAAVGSPKPLNGAYTGPTLEEKLQSKAVEFANNPKHLRIEDGLFIVSSVLQLYGDDFEKLGGVVAYFTSLTDPNLRADEDEIDDRLEIDFPDGVKFEFDWTVNHIRNRPKKK